MRLAKLFLLVVFIAGVIVGMTAAPALPAGAADLYRQAQRGRWFKDAEKLKPTIRATSDGMSFLVVWKATPSPKRWIVSLHGTEGFATDDLAIWYPNLKNRDVGVIALQWWLGNGKGQTSYYMPSEIYREVDVVLRSMKVAPGSVMLHGFSRGSANSYAVAAMDAGRGKHYFSLVVASSGGVGLDYPPTQAIARGEYGKRPLTGTRWVTAAGGKDPHPDRDGVPGMRMAAVWLKEQGAAVVARIEDPSRGHGAFQQNGNAKRALDLFFSETR